MDKSSGGRDRDTRQLVAGDGHPAPRAATARRPGRKALISAAVAGTLAVLAAVAGFVILRNEGTGAAPGHALEAAADRPLFAPPPMTAPFVPMRTLSPPYSAVDSTHLTSEGATVTLAYVAGLSRNGVCRHQDGLQFPCGLMGRASLQNRLNEREIVCQPVFYFRNDTRYRCFLDGMELARVQVQAGWARRDQVTLALYRAEQRLAREERRGAWSGGWRVR